MDQTILNILLGVAANALTTIIAGTTRKIAKGLTGKELLKRMSRQDSSIESVLKKSIDKMVDEVRWEESSELNNVCLFLASPEVESILRQLFATRLASEDAADDIDAIQQEFERLFASFVPLTKKKLKESSSRLFQEMLMISDRTISVAVDDGMLAAHEAKSSFRHRLLMDELSAVKKNLTFLGEQEKLKVSELTSFEKKFREQIAARHGFIIPPFFDAAKKLPIDDVYVPTSFLATPNNKQEQSESIDLETFLSRSYRGVILGNPGGGKSTLVQKICHDIATNYDRRILSSRLVTPIIVVLRDYGLQKKSQGCSIVQFITIASSSKYQISPPHGAIEYLLHNGRCVVFFDGLDELLDTSYRQEITADIELFCNLYPAIPVLVTSREIGYDQAPLDKSKFEIFRLNPFNDKQISDYAFKWFRADADLTSAEQTQKAESFIKESQIVKDLTTNPLMLSLMCNIYRGENYIPRNRPDLYEKCATMLFERWDKSRGIHFNLPFEAHINAAMKFLAFWIYSNDTLRGGVPESNLVAKAQEYLLQRRFEDPVEAEKAARDFITFCRGRAWVFTDVGTSKSGERLYQFTHQTFSEYFSAAHLVRTHFTPSSLMDFLKPKIAKREWDVVAQLSFQLQNNAVEGAADELLGALIEFAKSDDSEAAWNYLSFAARCLEFIIPNPRIAREIARSCFRRSIDWTLANKEKKLNARVHPLDSNPSVRLLGSLLIAASENRAVIADSAKKQLVDIILKGTEPESLIAIEIALDLSLPLRMHSAIFDRRPDAEEFWRSISQGIEEVIYDRVMNLWPKDLRLAISLYWKKMININDFLDKFGVASLFIHGYGTAYSPVRWSTVADGTLNPVVRPTPDFQGWNESLQFSIRQLEQFGKYILKLKLPCIARTQISDGPDLRWLLDYNIPDMKKLGPHELLRSSPDAFFGLFALFAVAFEAEKQEVLAKSLKQSENSVISSLRIILLARIAQKIDSAQIDHELELWQLQSSQKDLIWRWISQGVSFLES